jgi:hypothetical protein
VGDGRMLQPLVEEASKKAKVAKALGDSAYDTKSNFRYLDDKGIEPVIKVRRNASSRAGGCMPRKLVAQEYLQDPKAWKRNHGYGYRWMVESAISSLKRTFGEYVSARSMRNMAQEMMIKASLYNILRYAHRSKQTTESPPSAKSTRSPPSTRPSHSLRVEDTCSGSAWGHHARFEVQSRSLTRYRGH